MTPRPAVLFTAVYWAGLATGLLRFGSPLGAAAIAAGYAFSGGPSAYLAGAALLAGRLSAELAVHLERGQCASVLPAIPMRVRLRLLEPVGPEGGRIAAVAEAGCRGDLQVLWPRRRPVPAGSRVDVTARWNPRFGLGGRPAGMLVVLEATVTESRPGLRDALRNYAHRASHQLYGTRSGMVDALILGRRGGVDRELQDRFARSGLVHLLSISGFHVGLITAWTFMICRLAGANRSRALALAAGLSALYVAFLGWPAPAARAATLAIVMARCRARQRHVQANALLAATCLAVLLVDPWAALDLGGWLSAAALWGATRFTAWSDRAVGTGFWARTASSSVGATLATAPITAAFLGTVAVAGLLLNFPAIPLAALAVPGVLASLLLLPVWTGGAEALAAGAGLTLHLLELCAVAGAGLPEGHVLVEPGAPAAFLPWVGVLLLGLWIIGTGNTVREATRRLAWCATAALWLGALPRAGLAWSADDGPGLALHFLDVGQGDGAALRTPAGRWVVLDAGPVSRAGDAGRRVVIPFLERRGVRTLAAVIVSHAHADHVGGVLSLLDRFPVGAVIEPGAPVPEPSYASFLEVLARERIPWHPARARERFELDGVEFTVLHPSPAWAGWGEDVNEDSVVLLVEFGEFQALFTGDAGLPAEQALLGRLGAVDLLKVGHHGSRGSTGGALLDSIRPGAAVISVGRNDYGHPAPETLGRLAARRVPVLRTDRDGTISVLTDGRIMRVQTREDEWEYSVASKEQKSKE